MGNENYDFAKKKKYIQNETPTKLVFRHKQYVTPEDVRMVKDAQIQALRQAAWTSSVLCNTALAKIIEKMAQNLQEDKDIYDTFK
jgi:hypothetical protein